MDKLEMLTALKQAREFIGARAKMAGVGDGHMLLLSWFKALELAIHELSVDAVPVVRCKDCKYAHMTYDGECKYCDFWQEDGGDALYLDVGFFCAAGERREGDATCP